MVLIKRSRQTPSLLTLSTVPLFLHWRSPLPFCPPVFISIFSTAWAMLTVSISFCNLDFIVCHVFDVRSGHIYFKGQYSLGFFPFVCSIFLFIFFTLVVFCFQSFPCYYFPAAAPGISVLQGSLIPCRINRRVRLLPLEPRLFLYCPHCTTLSFRLQFPSLLSISFWWIS